MSHKAEYEAIKKQLADCEKSLKNRCIECANYNPKTRQCLKHGFVPADFIYSKNDCEYWDWLPF